MISGIFSSLNHSMISQSLLIGVGTQPPQGTGTRPCPDLVKRSYFRGTLYVITENGEENVDFAMTRARLLGPPLCKSIFSSNKHQIFYFFCLESHHFPPKKPSCSRQSLGLCRNPRDEKSSPDDFTPIKPLLEFYFK